MRVVVGIQDTEATGASYTVSGGGLLMFEHKIVDLHPQIVNLDPKIVVDGTAAPRDK